MLTDGTQLVPGETVVQISEGEATDSDNWQPVNAKSSTKSAPKDKNSTDEDKN